MNKKVKLDSDLKREAVSTELMIGKCVGGDC